ncbi:GNAT family N-acetyltransferase [Gramella sp. KN1008]|uniref:GNAT family N-acetyltransferase n=1 Tax=Gramella sp. KN1008 TaxID=2529298 RepID=UPI00103DEAA2|nr:GNAT family N-acetyltransferase [Gramella sp. KN1008]TBW25597.1 GNAT family N-acetyltransferase [Gramella sp. KN1008]
MIIRKATIEDLPEIVKVLKASLGEEQLALSEEIWRYKHFHNPFGESIVLVAEVDKKIVGVRAFMRWNWQKGKSVLTALRAVDTATHPQFQGRGIFKKLTLKAVEIAKMNDGHMIFNTPNDQSRPGYLKMGWKIVGKIKVGIKVSFSFIRRPSDRNYAVNIDDEQKLLELCSQWNNNLEKEKGLFTPKSLSFLKWRYNNNPLQKYEVIFENGVYLAGYVKVRKGLREFRIAECIYDRTKNNKKQISGIIKGVERKFGIHFVSYAPQLLSLPGIIGFYGPVLTLNSLNLSLAEDNYCSGIKNWNNSLGDLELF